MKEMMQDIDEFITSLLKSLTEAEAPLRKQQHKGLVTALARYGYTEQKTISFEEIFSSEYYDITCRDRAICDEVKPYRLFWRDGAFEIVHGDCHDFSHEHEQEFLQEMVPIIGRLDAQAHYDPGRKHERWPRLRIFMEVNGNARIEVE